MSDRAEGLPETGTERDGAAGIRQTVVIRNQRGLHARAAAKFVKLAAKFDCAVEVRRGDTVVSGESIMGLMMLAAGIGTQVELCAHGAEAEAAVAALADLIGRKFDED